MEIDILDEIQILKLQIEDLPENWDAKPPNLETQFIGDDFVTEREAAVLKVPSSIVSEEYNYLINPNHSEANKISVFSTKALVFLITGLNPRYYKTTQKQKRLKKKIIL